MFDIGFGELVLLALIALIVIGPERLPRVARGMGYWTGRARAYARNFTAELEKQADLADLKQSIHPDIQQAKKDIEDGLNEVKQAADAVAQSVRSQEESQPEGQPESQKENQDNTQKSVKQG